MANTVSEVTQEELESEALDYLNRTDWMVTKSVEDPLYVIDQRIVDKRTFARTLIDTSVRNAIIVDNINPIFYDEVDHLAAFKNLVVHKTADVTPPAEVV